MGDRIPKAPQVTQDVVINNNVAEVVGVGGLPIQNLGTPGGVLFVDANGVQTQCLPLGGEVSGTPDNVSLNPNQQTISTVLNKLIWEVGGKLVYDLDNTLTLEV